MKDEEREPASGSFQNKRTNLKLLAVLICLSALAFTAIILTSDKNEDEWLRASAYYMPSTGSIAINFHDISNNTQKGHVSMTKSNGEVLYIGDFTGSQQIFLLTNEKSAASETAVLIQSNIAKSPIPETVTFELELSDGRKLTKTIDVQIHE